MGLLGAVGTTLNTTVTVVTGGAAKEAEKAAKEAEEKAAKEKAAKEAANTNAPAATPAPAEEPAAVAEPEAATTGNSAVGSNRYAYFAKTESTERTSVSGGYEVEERDDKVIAVDFARRAAIAAQSKAASASLFETLESEPFSLMIRKQSEGDTVYGKGEYTPARTGEKNDLKA
ncbi:hypothetical protein GCM10011360_11680 [Primorskyibacter flagellatus]|uniref:Uncharacterized protein n=1 Tax=Primorskyibacter flagellatus TaxID=1387277 RepID=A0A917A4P9_9RHOB|nr:hypothetical protein [Primorskyibacter flagellatus]GGE24936.1 hypothetical protein GCM10011360_11680 [Primorskyibacter flagellatus]